MINNKYMHISVRIENTLEKKKEKLLFNEKTLKKDINIGSLLISIGFLSTKSSLNALFNAK